MLRAWPSPAPAPCGAQQVSTRTPNQVTVLIYNGGFTSGLGSKVGQAL